MGRKSQLKRPDRQPKGEPLRLTRRREVRILAVVALSFALVGALILLSDRSVWVAPENLVTVYRLHACPCAFDWKRELERQGLGVAMQELESLKYVRQRLRTPPAARGCHVGEFLGYFVEGHVDPAALRDLSRRHPAALGLSTETSTKPEGGNVDIASEANSRVLLVGPNGSSSVWFQPRASKKADRIDEEDRS